MTVKQSTLEKKWYYRFAKVFFLILPLIYVAIIFLSNQAAILNIRQDNIPEMLQKNIYNIVFAAAGIIAYYLLLKLIWGILLYILFGGVEDDTNIKSGNIAQAGNINVALAPNELKFNKFGYLAILAILFAIIFLAQSGYIKLPKIYPDSIGLDHAYGASCTSEGKAGLYGTNGHCIVCPAISDASTVRKNNCGDSLNGVYCCIGGSNDDNGGGDGRSHKYGTPCTFGGKTGLYGTDGKCYTCSSGVISTQKTNKSCSNGTAGTYCCSADIDSGCIKTGCEHLWYCSGRYYIGGQEITVPGICYPTEARNIYPSWSGTCRKCP